MACTHYVPAHGCDTRIKAPHPDVCIMAVPDTLPFAITHAWGWALAVICVHVMHRMVL